MRFFKVIFGVFKLEFSDRYPYLVKKYYLCAYVLLTIKK